MGISMVLFLYSLLKDEPFNPKLFLATGSLLQVFIMNQVFPRHGIRSAAMALCIWVALPYVRLDEALRYER